MHNNLYFYAGGEIDLEEKVSYGYNRLSSIAGNVYPNEVFQWFQNLLTEQIVSKQESEKIKRIMEQVYRGSAIVNLKKHINNKGISIGVCRSPLGNI